MGKFGAALHAEAAGAILTTATNWEDLEIQEEAESGSSVTSKIRLPVQVSSSFRSGLNVDWKKKKVLRFHPHEIFIFYLFCSHPGSFSLCSSSSVWRQTGWGAMLCHGPPCRSCCRPVSLRLWTTTTVSHNATTPR